MTLCVRSPFVYKHTIYFKSWIDSTTFYTSHECRNAAEGCTLFFNTLQLLWRPCAIVFRTWSVKLLRLNCGNTRERSGALPYHLVEAVKMEPSGRPTSAFWKENKQMFPCEREKKKLHTSKTSQCTGIDEQDMDATSQKNE